MEIEAPVKKSLWTARPDKAKMKFYHVLTRLLHVGAFISSFHVQVILFTAGVEASACVSVTTAHRSLVYDYHAYWHCKFFNFTLVNEISLTFLVI